jgi:type VI secretion system protein ImpC
VPRILLRAPHRSEDVSESFWFEEEITTPDTRPYLFGNAAFALAACIIRAFTAFHWCAAIRGWDGGLVDGLPCPSFGTDRDGVAVRGPTDLDLTDEREKDLAELGFIPLVHCKGRGAAVFYSTQSCQVPQAYTDPVASANARLSSQLQYLLVASRFAHYLKVMMRDRVGTFSEPRECQRMLQSWILQYCMAEPQDVSLAQKASRPLREARVDLEENKSKPGAYEAVVYLKPHFQLEGLNVQVEMRTELKEGRGPG